MEHYFINNSNHIENIRRINVQIEDISFYYYSDSGVFSKNSLDRGTEILLQSFDVKNDKIDILDLGSGTGAISLYLAKTNINSNVLAVDINEKTIKLLEQTIKELEIKNIKTMKSNAYENIINKFDMIVTNPPIRAGKSVVNDFVLNAKDYLKHDGELWVVINKKHGALSLKKKMEEIYEVEVINHKKGFYVFKAKIR